MRPVTWSPEAIQDVEGIHDYIAARNPFAARRVAAELFSSTDILRHFPELGRPAGEDAREWGTGKYVIVYRTKPAETLILRVWHGVQDRPGSR